MKTIIVPVDFSPVSENAAVYAAALAKVVNAKIILVHCVALPVSMADVPLPNNMLAEMTSEADHSIVALRNKLIAHGGSQVQISTSVISGYVISELQAIADEIEVFAVVMGCKGLGNSNLFMFGSTAIEAMQDLNCRVILVPEYVSYKPVHKIGLCSDMKDVNKVLPASAISEMVRIFDSKLEILYVNTDGEDMPGNVLPEAKKLQSLLSGINPVFHFVDSDRIDIGVTMFVKNEQIDMLLVIPKKHGFLGAVFHKSISKEIAQHLQVPIIILH